jgi:uncharacterized oligopeptide transporter (OPT) family protein
MVNIPPLAFALGMYIPQELNTPLLVGGVLAWLTTRGTDEGLKAARFSRGTLIASGFIAGGSLFGVANALLKFFDIDYFQAGFAESHAGEIVGLVMFVLLFAYAYWDTMRARRNQ